MVTKVTKKESLGKYTWTQTKESLTVSLPIKNVALKNIDVMIADLVLKVNVPSIRFFAVIDFPHEVDFESARNRS
jgi:dyslexia susceptibility 1 candidate gene 1 protein